MYRRQSRIVSPAFSSEMYEQLWIRTREIIDDMVKTEGWDTLPPGGEVKLDHMADYTHRIALSAIGSIAFGFDTPWSKFAALSGADHHQTP